LPKPQAVPVHGLGQGGFLCILQKHLAGFVGFSPIIFILQTKRQRFFCFIPTKKPGTQHGPSAPLQRPVTPMARLTNDSVCMHHKHVPKNTKQSHKPLFSMLLEKCIATWPTCGHIKNMPFSLASFCQNRFRHLHSA